MSDAEVKKKLFKLDKNEYLLYDEHFLEQYKLYVEITDDNSNRRVDANRFYITINSLMLSLIGVILKIGENTEVLYFWVFLVFIICKIINYDKYTVNIRNHYFIISTCISNWRFFHHVLLRFQHIRYHPLQEKICFHQSIYLSYHSVVSLIISLESLVYFPSNSPISLQIVLLSIIGLK